MIRIEQINYDLVDEKEYNDFSDKTIYTTKIWIDFWMKEKNIEPIVLKIYDDQVFLGYFTGGIIKKFGFKIFGSPLSGWFTEYMGLDFYVEYRDRKSEVYPYIIEYIFSELKCIYMEVVDQDQMSLSSIKYKYQVEEREAYITDLLIDESEIFSKFSTTTRRNVRKLKKKECIIIEDYSDEFINEYYEQLKDVFAKQNLTVHYSKGFVKRLIEHLKAGEAVYCIKAMSPNDDCVATFIQIGTFNKCFVFGSASYKEFLAEFRPNEAMFYNAICHYKQKGYSGYDYGGGGAYKAKFGGKQVYYKRYKITKYRPMLLLRQVAVKSYWLYKKVLYKLKSVIKK